MAPPSVQPSADRGAGLNVAIAGVRAMTDGTNGAHRRVLVIDDDSKIRMLLCNIFTRRGWTVLAVASAEEALAEVRRADPPYRLFVVDMVLNRGMMGLGLAGQIHRLHPDARFLFISGYTDLDPRIEDAPNAISEFIGKPMSLVLLMEKAERLISASPAGVLSRP